MARDTDILVVSAHPDDAEISAGGMLLLQRRKGRSIVLVDLTRGEAGTRGDGTTREREARAAAKMLGAKRRLLDFPDAGLHEAEGITEAIVQVIREFRPKLLLAPFPRDLHPDHAKAGECARAAFFLAGVKKRSPGRAAYRPKRLVHSMHHERFQPSFVVDVSSVWEEKMKLIACYDSQLRPADPKDKGLHLPSLTDISERVAVRDRFYGHWAGVRYAEPFFLEGPLQVGDPLQV